ncbi:SARP family transcriptional regulator [Phytohabitans suffuscus]|uniref:SARP family transcriptional regulator n=1 Tax=Phytohabitans suffuscus TaxID=624315 RepID=A0A6F8YIR7_9ACTN|nr:SARP family transcriptional regulator [Phytohabitans suffuscus]
MLAMLVVQSGRVVGLDELIDELWPADPPASAVPNARTYAANLRRLFDAAEPTRGLVGRQGDGYLLRADRSDIDLHAFLDDCQSARDLWGGGEPAKAATLLTGALARWRGPMLAGVSQGPVLAARSAALEEERLAATEDLADIHLELGQPAEAARLMRDHAHMHPLRERAYGLLMRARVAAGDVAGALSAYAAARRALGEELGIEPGPELRRLHRAALKPAAEPVPVAPTARPAASMPSWLPRRVADFTGRADLVARLLRAGREAGADPVIKVIDGMAGSGKTTLAVHVAHQLAEHYPDAQLFIDLQGHGESSPVEPAAALVTLLRQLGVPAERIPADVYDRVALWRNELASRRAIVVLDNAASTDQITPLLPTAPAAVVLVTSRRRLAAMEGGHPESLPLLSPAEAIDLLASAVGPERVRAEPEAAGRVAARCGYLPLAIRLAGARLAHRPGWRLADLADRLGHQASVLAELTAENRSIASAFGLSYTPLREPTKRMFRLLGLWPGEHFPVEAAAALSGLSAPEAALVIDELVDRHLVEEPDAGRFRLHDLMREYAQALALAVHAPAEREAAVRGLLDYYLHAVAAVTEPLEPAALRRHIALGQPMRPDLLEAPGAVDSAHGPIDSDWLERENANVRALVRHAEQAGHDGYAWRLARAPWRFHYLRGYIDDIVELHECGLRAAERLADDTAIASMHNYLASGYQRVGRSQEAVLHLEVAIRLRERTGDLSGAIQSRANAASVYWVLGRFEEAVSINLKLLAESWRLGGVSTLLLLPNLGIPLMHLGRLDEALRAHRWHLFMARQSGDHYHMAQALGHIGAVRVRMGDPLGAIRVIKASVALKKRIAIRLGVAESLNDLACAHQRLGHLAEAERLHRLALAESAAVGHRTIDVSTLNDLGVTLALAGRSGAAVETHEQALTLATRIANPYEQGRALAGIAAHRVVDDPVEARRHWERALVLFRQLNVPERHEVARRLADLLPAGSA